MYLVGASSLNNLLNSRNYSTKSSILKKSFTIPGLSLTPWAKDKNKILQNLLDRGALSKKRNLVVWHDIINNTISPHRSNYYQPYPSTDLCKVLSFYRQSIKAVLYCKRRGAPNILEQLKATGLIIIDIEKRIISKRNQKNLGLLKDLQSIHPSVSLEGRILDIVASHSKNLQKLSQKKRAPRKKLSNKRRKRKTKLSH